MIIENYGFTCEFCLKHFTNENECLMHELEHPINRTICPLFEPQNEYIPLKAAKETRCGFCKYLNHTPGFCNSHE